MANTITRKTILDGRRNLVVELHIEGDGSGEETATSAVDISTFSDSPSEFAIEKIYWSLAGFSAKLLWDATADVHAFTCIEGEGGVAFEREFGGPIDNNAGAGKTGDLLFTTAGLGAGDHGVIAIHARKRY